MATITKYTGIRGTTYHAKVRIKGHKPAAESFPKRRDAVKWAAATETAIREGRYSTGSDSPDLYCAVVVSLSTGGRWSEIMGLRWPQVSFTRKAIILYETKNGEARALPLEGLAFDLMLSRSKVRRIDTDLVFPAHNSTRPDSPAQALRNGTEAGGRV